MHFYKSFITPQKCNRHQPGKISELPDPLPDFPFFEPNPVSSNYPFMKKNAFIQLDFKLNFSKYTIEEDGLRITRKKPFSSKETLIKFEDLGTETIEEKDRKFVWLIFSLLFLIIALSVFIKRCNGGKVGNGAEIFHLTISFLFFLGYQIRSKQKLLLFRDTVSKAVEFEQTTLYRGHLHRFLQQLLQRRNNYLTNKYPTVAGLSLEEVINCMRARLSPSDGLLLKKLAKGRIGNIVFQPHDNGDEYFDAISCVTTKNNALNIIKNTRDQWLKEGKNIFIYEFHNEQYTLCLIGAADIVEIINSVGTDGSNYDIYTEHIIEKYKKWDHQFGLFPIGIGKDFCDFEIVNTKNLDYQLLAEEVYELSPDVVDQGTGTIDGLKEEMAKDGRIFLWWD
jgi:hypothetical protein